MDKRKLWLSLLATFGHAIIFISPVTSQNGILFPQESETRERKALDGIWNFRIAPRNDPDLGFRELWFAQPLEQVYCVLH